MTKREMISAILGRTKRYPIGMLVRLWYHEVKTLYLLTMDEKENV